MKKQLKSFILPLLLICSLNLVSQVPYADRNSTVVTDAWLSNSKKLSPNISRGTIHWIQYDLGGTYALDKLKLWNINTPDQLTSGAKTIIVDYSFDGKTWKEWGKVDVEKGTGSSLYLGQDGPNFSGLVTRYLLFNITENYGNLSEAGLSEIRVNLKPATVPVKDIVENIQIKAFPNPFNQSTMIDLGKLESIEDLFYQITNTNGQLIKNEKVSSNLIPVDGSNLPAGIYNFSIIHPSGKQTIQLTIAK
jgi:hypothetical protein